jgi:hypothetical protein
MNRSQIIRRLDLIAILGAKRRTVGPCVREADIGNRHANPLLSSLVDILDNGEIHGKSRKSAHNKVTIGTIDLLKARG